MDQVHFISGNGPLCGRADALWCTILREAVTCPRCLARLRAPGEGDAPPQAAASAASAPH